MSRKRSKKRKLMPGKPGAAPGTLFAREEAAGSSISAVLYGIEKAESLASVKPSEILGRLGQFPVTWIKVIGLGSVDTIRELGERLGLHPLVLEDILSGNQRPKVEDHGSYVFIVANVFRKGPSLTLEQVSIILGENYVMTLSDLPISEFDPVVERIMSSIGRIRSKGPDYLAYAILDAVVDSYFPLLEQYDSELEELEEKVWEGLSPEVPPKVHKMKKELLLMKRSVWPLKEVLSRLSRGEFQLVTADTRKFARDCLDHVVLSVELIESFRDSSNGLMDLHVSNVSNSTNEVMKTLTIIATIFIPLTFVAGIYGMNFDPETSPFNMPELKWYFGYPLALGLMTVIAGVMVLLFRRKGWLGGKPRASASYSEEI
ncbi:MAG: magnesium/cobalt transporter CorA [Planctomycetota bacterium]